MTDTDTDTDEQPTCGLGRSLGACALRSAGCERLLDVLVYLYPPSDVLAEMKARNDLTPSARQWLRRLAVVENGAQSPKIPNGTAFERGTK